MLASVVVGAVLLGAAGILGFRIATDGQGPFLRDGVVSAIDTDRSAVCLDQAGTVECYAVPGTNATLGQRVRFITQELPVDPIDRSKGMRSVLVFLEPAQATR